MPRTPLAQRLQETVSVVAEAAERGTSVERVLEERTTRRELLKRGGAAGVDARRMTGWQRSAVGGSAACCAEKDAGTRPLNPPATLRRRPPRLASPLARKIQLVRKIQQRMVALIRVFRIRQGPLDRPNQLLTGVLIGRGGGGRFARHLRLLGKIDPW